jgi:predicted acyl esterase
MLSAGNWGGQNLHLRGNVEAFVHAASNAKWLELHGVAHWTHFYTDYGVGLQKRFFAHYLKGEDNGWERTQRVILNIRHIPERYVQRTADAWPLPESVWTKLHFDPARMRLSATPPAESTAIEYDPMGPGLTFESDALEAPMEITGPMVARVAVAGSALDVDLFLIVRVFDPDGHEVTFQGAVDPNTPISQGWLRLSHRKTDPIRSEPYRPWRPHDELLPVVPGEVYTVDVEIWPSCIVIPPGYSLAVTIKGSDYVYEGALSEFAKTFHYANRGVGPYTHADPDDRPPEIFGKPVSLHLGGDREGWILLPVIPGDGTVAD